MTSWKTTLAGAVSALGLYFTSLPGNMHLVGQILTGVGTFLVGMWARDNDKSSENVGAK